MAAAQLLLFHSPVERWSGFVRLVLEEKELEYDTNTVNSLVCENRQPWYLKELNENGDLPTLVYKNKACALDQVSHDSPHDRDLGID